MSKLSFLQFMQERDQLDEAFNSAPYELTMGKKNAGDVFFTFVDEDEKEYRIQFYTPQGLGKSVRQVFIGQKRGSVYPDAIARFKNPMRVIASMIEATKQFMATPLGKTIDGFAVNFSKKALDRGMTLIPKIIRQSGLKQKLNVMDLTYAPVPDRGYVWLVRKGKDPAQVFDGPKMQGITWDDPDKVGDVPVQNNTPDVGVSSSVDNSNGWKLTSNGDQPMLLWAGKERGRMNTANIAPHYNEPGVYVGAYMNEKPVRGQSADFIARQLKLPQVPISILNDFTTASTKFWKGSQNSSDRNNPANIIGSGTAVIDAKRLGAREVNVERFKNGVRMRSQNGDVDISISDPDFSNAASATDAATASVVVKNGRYEGAINSKRKTARISNEQGTEWDIIGVNGETLVSIKLNKVSKSASDSTEGATSVDQLRNSGFIARVLGIIDTNVGLDTSILPGENIRRVGAGRYTTAGGLVIVVNFTNVLAGFVQYSVFSEIAEEENVAKGSARDVANAVIASIFEVAKTQYTGKWEISAVPTSAPYPIKAIRRSRGWGYVETANWTLTVSDAVLNRVKPGKTALLELIKEPPRGKHPLEIIPEKGDKTLMLKDRITGAIYGSIDLNAQGADLVNSGTLNIPSNAMVFGETVNGMSITWSGVNFPKTGKYDGAVLTTNVTYYYDKGKVAITPIVSNKGRTLNNPKTYELTLKKDIVQAVIDEISSKMEMISRNIQTLKSTSYNPKQVFLDDISVDNNGSVLWRGYDMADRRTNEFMLGILSKETERLEKESSTAKKTGADLAAYADSIRDNAPKGRDLDWQIYASRDGQTLNVDWDITFRRNTTEGAYREFKSQIDRANQYLQTLYRDAKSKGYNPTEPNLMTLDSAQQSDQWARDYGEGAYSEYEQSLGGNMQIKI
ncbi:hypothetical protein RPN242_gp086 [Escherichia phage vB_EcoM-RPN242]|nr:hypothetical protein RPN242_gp086 [Escherichia phage vB_EcoM-RPN242]